MRVINGIPVERNLVVRYGRVPWGVRVSRFAAPHSYLWINTRLPPSRHHIYTRWVIHTHRSIDLPTLEVVSIHSQARPRWLLGKVCRISDPSEGSLTSTWVAPRGLPTLPVALGVPTLLSRTPLPVHTQRPARQQGVRSQRLMYS